MSKHQIRTSFQALLREGKVEEVLEQLAHLSQTHTTRFSKELTSLRSTFFHAKEDFERRGRLSPTAYTRTIAQVVSGLTQLLRKIGEGMPTQAPVDSPATHKATGWMSPFAF